MPIHNAVIATAPPDPDLARFDLTASLPNPRYPGGSPIRTPRLVLAMLHDAMRDLF